MSYSLSILDKSPIAEGASAHDALNFTIALAKRAEALGYKRYWIAEHHSSGGLASASLEILIGQIAAATKNIRAGPLPV